eukprot:CAMPEP_0167741296 /NCGR_PEP_ID=MMETSP0110_2-20121227/777_1 /TAXON_ID=629695 /ORGANISM="Gymnochlora sp., Strain CCMP2014" /LENGTH=196 /DNA_ID=CAMNT_0007625331 /DNA_START=220 /DNA_END=807 /DNA_ORIENTATION=-
MDTDALDRWKAREIARLGVEGFNRQSSETLQTGHKVHSLIEDYLLSLHSKNYNFTPEEFIATRDHSPASNPSTFDRAMRLWDSVSHVLARVTRVCVVESSVHHKTLEYAGTIDCIVELDGVLRIIDWKTSKRRKTIFDLYDNPLQIAAYTGALYTDDRFPQEVLPTRGSVVVMYDDAPADVFDFSKDSLEDNWKLW